MTGNAFNPIFKTMPQNTLNNTKFSKERLNKILNYLREGRHISHAAAMSGIHVSTLYNWIEMDENGDERFKGVSELVHEAKSEGEIKLEKEVIRLCNAGKNPDSRTLMHLLSTKNRPVYANLNKVEVEANVKVDLNWGDFIKAMDGARDKDGDKT